MPVAVGASIPPVISLPPPELSDAYVATWTEADGTVWPLMVPERGWHSLDGVVAHGAIPISLATDPFPSGGAKLRHIQEQPRLITWPLRITGMNHGEMVTNWRDIMRAFTRTRFLGPGTLTIARPDGTARQIQAYYQDGFEGQPGELSGWQYDTAVLTLFCGDGAWTGLDPIVIRREYSGGSTSFLDPYITVSSSQTLGDTIATNPGDLPAWPEWTITGPASGITATNNLTGETFTLDPNATGIAHGNLLAGETVTITTRPPTVRGPDGSVWTAALNFPTAVLWPLYQGDNPVTFTLSGSGAGSSVTLSFLPRYESD